MTMAKWWLIMVMWLLFGMCAAWALRRVIHGWRVHRVEPPVNVRLAWDTTVVSVDTVYVGRYHGVHVWLVVAPAVLTPADRVTAEVTVDHLPPRTGRRAPHLA